MAENVHSTLNNNLRQKSNFSKEDYATAKSRLRRLANVPLGQSIVEPNSTSTRNKISNNSSSDGEDDQINSPAQIRQKFRALVTRQELSACKDERHIIEKLALQVRRAGCPGTQEQILLDLVDELQAARTCKNDHVAKSRRKCETVCWRLLENAKEVSDERTERFEKLMATQRESHELEKKRTESAGRAKLKGVVVKHREEVGELAKTIRELEASQQVLREAAEENDAAKSKQIAKQVVLHVRSERQKCLDQFDQQVITVRQNIEKQFQNSLEEAAAREKALRSQLENQAQEKNILEEQCLAFEEQLEQAQEATHRARCMHDDTARDVRALQFKLEEVQATDEKVSRDIAVETRASKIAAQQRESDLLAKHEEELIRVHTRVQNVVARKEGLIKELQLKLADSIERAEYAESVLLRVEEQFVGTRNTRR